MTNPRKYGIIITERTKEEEKMFTVFTEIHENGRVERWYYGTYNDRDFANEVAIDLGNEWPVYHCVCRAEEAEDWGILNLPR